MAESKDAPGIARKVEGFFGEFWSFAAKGNIFDLAVGVILGNAFSAVVNSLVADILSPFIALASNNADFSAWTYTIRDGQKPLVVNFGHLTQVTMNFLIVALCIFIFFKIFSRLRQRLERREEVEEKAAPPVPVSTEEKLLCEIRDILRDLKERPPTK